MTDSIEKPTPRQPRFNPENENFDSVDENNVTPNSFADNESILSPTRPVAEIKTNFYVDYFDKRKKSKTAQPEPVFAAEDDQSSAVDYSSQDYEAEPVTLRIDKTHSDNHAPVVNDSDMAEEIHSDSHAPVVNGSGMAVAVLSQFKSRQESINKQQEKQIQDFAQKVKKATTVTYASMFFGAVSLAAATVLGFMLLETQSKVSDLAGTTTTLKDNLRNIKTSPDDMLEGTDPSIDQLSLRVDDIAEQLHEVAALQNKASRAEISKTANKSPDNELDVAEKKPSAEAIVKAAPVTKIAKNTSTEQTQATAVSATTAKPVKPANKPAVTPKKGNEQPDKTTDVPANDINNVINSAASSQAGNNAHPQTASGGWTVNLGSSNRLEDAKKTANNFAKKGIPVTISSVTVKNETRYRLQVKGFKSKEEATAYANKAKDALKINSVWINP